MVMDSGESIYALIPVPQEVPTRPPMHKSKFPGKFKPKEFEFGQNKHQGHATMGRADGLNASSTAKPLRAHEKEPLLPEPGPPTMRKDKIRPPVPARDEKPVMGLTSNKNFITSNAVDAILAKPKNVPQEEFRWTMKPDYGRVPVYLKRNKTRIAMETQAVEEYRKLREAPEASARVSQLSTDDRAQLLRHLKLKWQAVNKAYQGLSLSIDSAPKKLKKEDYERELAEIEKDIKTLERGEVVLIVDE